MTSRPLRVAIVARAVAPFHGRGGLERHVGDLITHLEGAGVETTLVTRAARKPVAAAMRKAFPRLELVPYRTFPFANRRWTTILDRDTAYPLFGWRAGRRALSLVRAGRIDIVHSLGASALGYAVARRTHHAAAPLVLNPQGLEEFGATDPGRARAKRLAYWPLRRAVMACAHAADAVIATDASLRPVVLRHLPVPAGRVAVVPNAVDLDRCDRLAGPADAVAIRERHGLAPDALVFVSAGRLEENKGFHVLARALGRLSRQSRSLPAGWRWVLVGDGPWAGRIRSAAAAAGIASHMIVPGRTGDADLHAWFEAATLFVHPTLYEGSSLVTLEAMAHRRPIVATRAGGLPDKVRPGTNGWLVPPGDDRALADALFDALRPGMPLAEFGRNSRRIAEHEFAWGSITGRLMTVYEWVSGTGGEAWSAG